MMSDVWSYRFVGITVGQAVLVIFILAVALAVRRLFGYAVMRAIRFWSGRSKGAIDNAVVEALAPPIRFIPIVLATWVISVLPAVSPWMTEVLFEVSRSLIAFTLFWAVFEIVAPALSIFEERSTAFSRATVGWVVRAAKILIACLGGAVVLEVWGIHVGPILAGLGLVGAAVALGAQDLFKNLIAGIFIIGEQRFQNGDSILVDGVVEGTIEMIGLRTRKVRRPDLAPVFVPNSKLAENALTNFSQMTHRRIS